VQTCIVHLIRNSLSFVSWQDRKRLVPALRKVKAPPSRPLDRLNVATVSIIQPFGTPDRRRRA
jgi:transposase-like protein